MRTILKKTVVMLMKKRTYPKMKITKDLLYYIKTKSWILLDSQSTVDVFSNGKLLSNIRDLRSVLTLHCDAGKAIVNQKGDLKGCGTVWYHPKGVTNILSLHNVQKKHKVTYDSSMITGFIVHNTDGTYCIFEPSQEGAILF